MERKQTFEGFCDEVAGLTGLTAKCGPESLDGDRALGNAHPDPACLDELGDWWREGESAADCAGMIVGRMTGVLGVETMATD